MDCPPQTLLPTASASTLALQSRKGWTCGGSLNHSPASSQPQIIQHILNNLFQCYLRSPSHSEKRWLLTLAPAPQLNWQDRKKLGVGLQSIHAEYSSGLVCPDLTAIAAQTAPDLCTTVVHSERPNNAHSLPQTPPPCKLLNGS